MNTSRLALYLPPALLYCGTQRHCYQPPTYARNTQMQNSNLYSRTLLAKLPNLIFGYITRHGSNYADALREGGKLN